MSTGIATDSGQLQPMRKQPMSHIHVDRYSLQVHYLLLSRQQKRSFWAERQNVETRYSDRSAIGLRGGKLC
jgi:hypothetical protein